MNQLFKKVLNLGPKPDLKGLVKTGAQIIDVRSKEEFRGGHLPGSVNIPLENLSNNLSKIAKGRPVITCCASGMRSDAAKSILKSKGFTQVYNGGGWRSLQAKIS